MDTTLGKFNFEAAPFTELDKKIAVAMLRKLPVKQKKALVMRFWLGFQVEEVASRLRMTWAEADQLISNGLDQLRSMCMVQPKFRKVNIS